MDIERFIPLIVAIIIVPLVHRFIIEPKIMGIVRKKNPLEAVRYFRKMGFFEEYLSLSDKELSENIATMHEDEYEESLDPKDERFDLFVLYWSKKRIWWKDIEMDVDMGQNVYVRTLREWAAISRGVFNPKNVKESWESPQGPVEVTFTLNGEKHTITPKVNMDYLDNGIIYQINPLIKSTGYQFVMYKPFDQTAFILVLTKKEIGKLIKERFWKFYV